MSEDSYEGWAKLELMGHRTRVGRVKEVEMYGGKMLRIDIPTAGDDITEYYGAASVYSLMPITEELGRDYAARYGDPRPVRPVGYRIESAVEDDGERLSEETF